MAGYPYRLQVTWWALLAWAWLALCSPWPLAWNGALAIGIAVAVLVAWAGLTRRQRHQAQLTTQTLAVAEHRLDLLPPAMKQRTPLVIAGGDTLAMARHWGDERVRLTDTAIWARCDSPAMLLPLAAALTQWRHGQAPDAIVLMVAADEDESDSTVAARAMAWGTAIRTTCRTVGDAVPVALAVSAAVPGGDTEDSPWCRVSDATTLRAGTVAIRVAETLAQEARVTEPNALSYTAERAAWIDGLGRWVGSALLPHLTHGRAALSISALALATVSGPLADARSWGQFLAHTTALVARGPASGGVTRGPLPDALLRDLPRQPVRRPAGRALAHALIALMVSVAAGTAASAWQNRALMTHVAAHVARYRTLLPAQDTARLDALAVIEHDRHTLDTYATLGIPPRLDFGLYRGARWLPALSDVIASYRPPAPPPTVVELDSLSLFATGRATLSPGANRVLVNALDAIKSHPGQRVLVAGYTDAVGRAAANLTLSLARAAAVRDWLIDASGLPSTRFAIQGYGDTRPKVSNDTAAGRAINRRVQITLIPDCRDDRGGPSTPSGPAACF